MDLHMDGRIPSSLEDWQVLNANVEQQFKISITPEMKRVIWFVTISGPITAVLYLLSAWKRYKSNGNWIVRVDEEGYWHPHTFVAIPIAAFVFTSVNLYHSICLLSDLSSHIRTRTIVSCLLTFPVLSAFGWTRIWSLLYAMPPSKYRITQAHQRIGQPPPRFYWATFFNLSIVAGYLLCLFGTAPSSYFIIKNLIEVQSAFKRYQKLYSELIQVFTNPNRVLSTQLQTLIVLKHMADCRDKIRQGFRVIHIVLLLINILEIITMLWPSYRILAALYYQVMILRQAGKRLNHIRMNIDRSDFMWSREPTIDGNLKIASTPKADVISRSTVTTPDSEQFKFRIKHSLPTFKRGTGVSAALWKSGPFRKTEEEMIDGGVRQMIFYYRQLRSYAMNTFWQTVITTAVLTSFLVLLGLLVGGTYNPKSNLELEVTVFLWINITWNCGTGLLLSIISCIVAFSPAPSVPREPTQSRDEGDDYF